MGKMPAWKRKKSRCALGCGRWAVRGEDLCRRCGMWVKRQREEKEFTAEHAEDAEKRREG